MRVTAAPAAQVGKAIPLKPVISRFQRMLAGKQEEWFDAAAAQCVRDGCELDGFGAGADCNRDCSGQPSP